MSRAFAKATGRASGRGDKERGKTGAGTGGTTVEDGSSAAVESVGRRMEGTRLVDGRATTTEAAKRDDDATSGGGVGKSAAKKMRVEDFEPLKLIGRGAFGAWNGCEASEG